jgi:hypothetical protein
MGQKTGSEMAGNAEKRRIRLDRSLALPDYEKCWLKSPLGIADAMYVV